METPKRRPERPGGSDRDHVDRIVEQWREQRPDLDVSTEDVVARISRLERFLQRSMDGTLSPFGLNEPQFAVLAALRRAGPPYTLSPTVLYGSLLVSSGAMTNRLTRLEAGGLVRRVPDRGDGRSMLVVLTPRGRSVIDRALAACMETRLRFLAGLQPRERTSLAGLLRRVLANLGDAY
jgi:DNA-binding MarR family transcriptional regulator